MKKLTLEELEALVETDDNFRGVKTKVDNLLQAAGEALLIENTIGGGDIFALEEWIEQYERMVVDVSEEAAISTKLAIVPLVSWTPAPMCADLMLSRDYLKDIRSQISSCVAAENFPGVICLLDNATAFQDTKGGYTQDFLSWQTKELDKEIQSLVTYISGNIKEARRIIPAHILNIESMGEDAPYIPPNENGLGESNRAQEKLRYLRYVRGQLDRLGVVEVEARGKLLLSVHTFIRSGFDCFQNKDFVAWQQNK